MEHVENVRHALRPETWERAGQRLLEKMISEFMYEEIILPERVAERGGGVFSYRLSLPGGVGYAFEARRRLFDTYRVVPGSVVRTGSGAEEPATDPLRFLLDIREAAGLSPETAAHLLNEYSRTLLADAHILARKEGRALDPEEVGYAELEGEMEGHPWITFNKGRIGFGYDDHLLHAPEMQRPIRRPGLAVGGPGRAPMRQGNLN